MKGETDLVWYFGNGQAIFGKSQQGALLERAEVDWFSSEKNTAGNHIKHPFGVGNSSYNYMTVKSSNFKEEPSYTPDEGAMLRFSEIEKRLRRLSDTQLQTLFMYYGPIGSSWLRDNGRGRRIAVATLTPVGKKWIAQLRTDGSFGSDDQILGEQMGPDTYTRSEHHTALEEQIDKLVIDAFGAWKKTDPTWGLTTVKYSSNMKAPVEPQPRQTSKVVDIKRPPSYVYFITGAGTDTIKIGVTESVKERVKALQTASPVQLQVVAVFRGTRDDEQRLHGRFHKDRLHGEWFKYSDEIRKYIEEKTDSAIPFSA